MATIKELVYSETPFLLSPNDDTKVELEIQKSQIYLQKPLGKTDLQVFVEAEYTELEKLLVAYHTSFKITSKKAEANITGEGGASPTIDRLVKKSKADVVEAEFESASSENSFMLSTMELLKQAKKNLCNTAQMLNIVLPECGCAFNPESVQVPFMVVGC